MKKLLFLLLMLSFFQLKAQPVNCTFKQPQITINFGSGHVPDLNTEDPSSYRRVSSSCPTDGHYTYTSYTSDCFRSDWLTLPEDHTPGDVDGNMMLVNASPYAGAFLKTTILGLKGGTIYEFSVWLMNLCKPSDKCPFPLLPNITILLQSADGKVAMQCATGELVRRDAPQWTRYQVIFTTPATPADFTLTMTDNSPGGCGNDFAMDDISFRECIKTPPVVSAKPKSPVVATTKPKSPVLTSTKPKAPVVVQRQPVAVKPAPKKQTPAPEKRQLQTSQVGKPQIDTVHAAPVVKQKPPVFTAPPPVIATRANPVIKTIELEPGEITFKIYDNGIVDGDTVTIYHNNTLLVSHARLSEKPITFSIAIDAAHPHHELVMVADNLGSIPPNTSLMVVTAGTKRYEIFISSTEQKNAKVIFDLKE